MIQATALLKACVALLMILGTADVTPEFRTQVMQTVDQAILVANDEIAKAVATPVINQPTPPMTEEQPAAAVVAPAPTAPVSQARIDIVNPFPGKGLGREYVAAPEVANESNYVEIGAVVYDEQGNVDKNAVVTITATDEGQNKVLNGSGDLFTIYVDGERRQVYGFAFHYEFKQAGEHTVTFSANGMLKSVTMSVK